MTEGTVVSETREHEAVWAAWTGNRAIYGAASSPADAETRAMVGLWFLRLIRKAGERRP